jgi:uncharacterized protein
MSAAALIDTLEFARAQDESSGSVEASALGRLDDVLFDQQGQVRYVLRGSRDARNRPLIEVELTGDLNLQCQRCLGKLEYSLAVRNVLRVVLQGEEPDESDLEDPEAPDVIDANAQLPVTELIEDEVLLSLPLAPRHAEGVCESRLQANRDRDSDAVRETSAFAQLAALKRPHNHR